MSLLLLLYALVGDRANEGPNVGDPDLFSLQGDKSQKTLLEKTLTRALMEPDLVNTGSYYYYDLTTHAIRVTTDAVKTMKEKVRDFL